MHEAFSKFEVIDSCANGSELILVIECREGFVNMKFNMADVG